MDLPIYLPTTYLPSFHYLHIILFYSLFIFINRYNILMKFNILYMYIFIFILYIQM
jgi:hypothetical protein